MSLFNSFSASTRLVLAGTATLLLGLAASCTYSHGDPAPACDVPHENVTYANVISPIFDAHCRECHNARDYPVKGGGNNFGDYQAINSYFSPAKIVGCIRQEDPKFIPMPQGRPKLSDCDIQRIEAWVTAGKPNN